MLLPSWSPSSTASDASSRSLVTPIEGESPPEFGRKSSISAENMLKKIPKSFVPVVAAIRSSPPRGTAPLLRFRTPPDGRRRAARRRELPEVAPDTRATMPAPRRNVRSTQDGGPAVQPPGLSYAAHWEALGCALCLLTTPEISSSGPVRGRGFCPGSHRPRARVPSVVWAWDFCYAASLLRSPGPCSPTVFRSAICDCLSINECLSQCREQCSSPEAAACHEDLIELRHSRSSIELRECSQRLDDHPEDELSSTVSIKKDSHVDSRIHDLCSSQAVRGQSESRRRGAFLLVNEGFKRPYWLCRAHS